MREEAAFLCEARSAGAARSWAHNVLDGWPVREVDDLAILLVSEVVSNALLHAQTDVRLVLDLRDDRHLVVEAWDTGPGRPVLQSPTAWDESGRGLRLVEELSSSWGWTFAPGAKCVWFELSSNSNGAV
jgi:anti-sigma regulatory factor (Ser/Thr protein kinase)